jgi:hypothetical protein
MLLGPIKALGEVPSPRVGAFYGMAMAIADVAERITFLNRGQGWVMRKLREMLPRVRNARLHADLSEMLRSHWPILPSRRTLSPTRRNRGAALSSAGESALAGPLRPSQTKSPSFCGRVRPAL